MDSFEMESSDFFDLAISTKWAKNDLSKIHFAVV